MNNDFYLDLADGKRGERLVAAALAARGHKVDDLSDNREYQRKDIDMMLTSPIGQVTTLEVKNDMASERTGNVFIETYNECNKSHAKQGWYFYCCASFICFCQEDSKLGHIISYEDLRQAVETKQYREVSTRSTKGYLLPIEAVKALPSYFCLLL